MQKHRSLRLQRQSFYLYYDKSRDNVKDKIDKIEKEHNVQVERMGTGMESTEIGGSSESIGIIVAFVVLFITFGSFIAAGMPIVSAILGLGTNK